MPSRKEVLTELTTVYRRLYDLRLATVSAGPRISQQEEEEMTVFIQSLDRLRTADPFPEVGPESADGLNSLSQRVHQEDIDEMESRQILLSWATQLAPPSDSAPRNHPHVNALPHPANLRMLNNMHQFVTAMTRARIRLIQQRDPYDKTAYTSARNAYALAKAAYEPRLENDRSVATLEQNVAFERDLLEPLSDVAGGDFPTLIQSAADFIRECLFGPDTFVA